MSNNIRKNCKDLWNGFMVKNASFSNHDIPLCPTTAKTPPKSIISYAEAKTIYKRQIRDDKHFYYPSYVHFYIDDQVFDGKRKSIWLYPKQAYNILKHFEGIIAPDFSTYLDFPYFLKGFNYYRMNAFGYWYGILCGKNVIVNARWDYENSFNYCFDGIKEGDIVAIGTVASQLKQKKNYERFEVGLRELINTKHPKALIIVGTINIPIFNELSRKGIEIIHFRSSTDLKMEAYKNVKK